MKFKKLIYLILFLFTFTSCTEQKENKILYEFHKDLSKSILKIYNNRDKNTLYYVEFNIKNLVYENININSCNHNCSLKSLILKSNRFLKLDDTTFIPVIFSTDYLFSKKTKSEINKGVFFDLIDGNQLLKVRGSL